MAATVLVVDDHAGIRRMVRACFEAEDFEIYDATNGADGVETARTLKPSLIILDLSMPVMNGLEAARALKALMPQVPLLMFTSHAGAIVEKEARSAGCRAVIWKSDSDWLSQLMAHTKALLGHDPADEMKIA